jgi:hypothetical protein
MHVLKVSINVRSSSLSLIAASSTNVEKLPHLPCEEVVKTFISSFNYFCFFDSTNVK